jgi:hypothetical protein
MQKSFIKFLFYASWVSPLLHKIDYYDQKKDTIFFQYCKHYGYLLRFWKFVVIFSIRDGQIFLGQIFWAHM